MDWGDEGREAGGEEAFSATEGAEKKLGEVTGGEQAVTEAAEAGGRAEERVAGLFRKRRQVSDDDGDEPGDGKLDADGVLAAAVQFGDAELAFEETEEELDLPAFAVHRADFGCCPVEQVGEEDDGFLVLVEGVQDDPAQAGGSRGCEGPRCA